MRIALFSDIHALADTYRLAIAEARDEGFDYVIVMGDLLTYGTQVEETLQLTDELVETYGAVVLRGNHDQLYFDLERGDASYLDGRPQWIVESACWTAERVVGLEHRYAWQNEWQMQGVLVSHANPFGGSNWSYVNDERSASAASQTLLRRGLGFGVFGHVHRHCFYDFEGLPKVATVGSIGQPRQADGSPEWALLTLGGDAPRVEWRPVRVDRRAHVEAISRSGMSQATVQKLAEFFMR